MAEPDEEIGPTADSGHVTKAGKKDKRVRHEELDDIRYVLVSKQGRRFIWKYLSLCGVFKTSWHPSVLIHFNEGRRDIGLHIMDDITEADPNSLVKMMLEAKERDEKQKSEKND